MGGSQSNPSASPDVNKKVVVIGASFGGKTITKEIQAIHPGCKILQVDKNEHFEFICTNYQSVVKEQEFKNNSVMFNEAVKSYGEGVSFMQGKLIDVDSEANQVEIECPDGKCEKVDYDVLVIVTGASYVSPWRGDSEKCLTYAEREQEVKEVREKVKAANSVLCVGAGPTGLETVAYLKEQYPDKKIAVCQRGKKLLPSFDGAHEIALKQLTALGVEVLLERAYDPDTESEFEFVIDCRGFKYKGPSGYLKGPLAECIDKKTGQIWVDKYGRVNNKHPISDKQQPSEHKLYKNIFSFGDVCLTPRNEMKTIVSMIQYGCFIANNIVQTLSEGTKFQEIPEHLHRINGCPLGSKGGIICFNKMINADKNSFKGKMEIRDRTMGVFRGEKKWIEDEKKTNKGMKSFFGAAQGCCVCLPMHLNKQKADNNKNLEETRKMFDAQY